MVSALESANSAASLSGALDQGLNTLSSNDSVTFTKYVRLVLPLDGFVFWVRADLVTQSSLLGSTAVPPPGVSFNDDESNEFGGGVNPPNVFGSVFNAPQTDSGVLDTITVKGSVHTSNNHNQAESESEGVTTVTFTAQEPVQHFTALSPDVLWLGEYKSDDDDFDDPVSFAFSARGSYYVQANLHHYSGTAVLPAFRANLIDDVQKLNLAPLYVSNSLPAWLALSNYDPPYDNGINCHLPLYPSFLVPENLTPPYGVVHIDPGVTGHQSAPYFDRTLGQWSLTMDKVRVTLYGLSNDAALFFLAAVLQYSADYEVIGMSNIPVVRDEKRIQPELGVLALKKTIEFEVWYNQASMRNVARQQIKKLVNSYYPQPLTAVGFVPPAP
jgi:hypothetical protein